MFLLLPKEKNEINDIYLSYFYLFIFFSFQLDFRNPPGYDRTRGVEIGNKDFDLTHLEEAYTTEHWLVRIYKVKDLDNRQKVKARRPIKKTMKRHTSKTVSKVFILIYL